MSEQSQLPLSQDASTKNVTVSSTDQSRNKAFSESPFRDYMDLECESSGIFGNLDIETAKKILDQIQE